METKLYIRDGSRFKYVPNMLGMYWNGLILTEKKIQDCIAMVDSIAVVIEQHYDHVVMASLITSKSNINWYEAENWCKNSFDGKGRLPSNTELINLKKYINADIIDHIWGEEHFTYTASCLNWYDDYIYYATKSTKLHARSIAVTDVPILDLI